MRIALIGGTKFIGRWITSELAARGHDLLLIHRGVTEPEGLPEASHVHVDRKELPTVAERIRDFRPEALVDTVALTRADAEIAVQTIPPDIPVIVLSSMDVYRAYSAFHSGIATELVPLDERSPVRDERYPYRGKIPDMDDYEKLDVEDVYVQRGATIFRLGFVYGEFDGQRREEFILKRVRAGRMHIPFGAGNFLGSRLYAPDAAKAVANALETPEAENQIFNLCERKTPTIKMWAESILAAADHPADLVTVPDDCLPPDLRITAASPQHFLGDSSKARALLKWQEIDPAEGVRRSVRWHLANPPEQETYDPEADNRSLETEANVRTPGS